MPENLRGAPTIELDGIRLRALRPADAASLCDYLLNPVVTELTSYGEITLAGTASAIQHFQKRWSDGGLSKWGVALQTDDRVVGACGFVEWSERHGWATLAYDLAPEYWGRGLMSQAVAAALGYAFRERGLNRLQAYVMVRNDRSEKLLRRAGFTLEGILREFRICSGQPADFGLFSLLRSEWGGGDCTRTTEPINRAKHSNECFGPEACRRARQHQKA